MLSLKFVLIEAVDFDWGLVNERSRSANCEHFLRPSGLLECTKFILPALGQLHVHIWL